MNRTPLILFIVVLFYPAFGIAQNVGFIWEPEFSYSWKQSDRLAFNSKTSAFNNIKSSNNGFAMEHIETAFSVAYNLSVETKVGVGYLFRISDPLDNPEASEYRLLQQLAVVSFIGDRRLSHRLRTEQRIQPQDYINRWRYRISYDFPLEGERLDPGEKYLIISNEILGSFNKSEFEGENRVNAGLGFYKQKRKLEFNIEYRTQDLFTNNSIGHTFVFSTTFYLNR